MGIFNQAKRKPAEPDPNFPGLDRSRATELRTELRQAAAHRGASVRITGRSVLLDHPRFGTIDADLSGAIRQLSANVHPKAPQRIAQALVDQMLAGPQGRGSKTANVYASLRPRLIAVADGNGDFTNDTSLTVVIDTGEGYKRMANAALARIDDLETLHHAARVNLRKDIESTYDVDVKELPDNMVAIEAVSSEIANAAIDLDLVLDTFAPRVDRSKGLLFAMPSYSTILVCPVSEGKELIDALNDVAKMAITYPTARPLSRLVHFWHEGVVETLSSFDREAQAVVITPNDYLMRLLRVDGEPEG
ncbi:hypothetical protein QP027_03700 [Corynebacterium breve]|uniref:HNH endonuclease n=1 Tax=Corynebacterium breve TaxID=3049799 RepID=A0ABY8VHS3_9CORY|nr:hypothetical protein [Corynebacterium breve]WIM68511.1 hypothetical protein QP027_03700 [Corynebacterium breve]